MKKRFSNFVGLFVSFFEEKSVLLTFINLDENFPTFIFFQYVRFLLHPKHFVEAIYMPLNNRNLDYL